MTVVDSSAVISIMLGEDDAATFASALQRTDSLQMSAGTLLELGTVALHKGGATSLSDLFEIMSVARIIVAPFSEDHARTAIDAYKRFGKGSQHPAKLNFGDCFSYALAKSLGATLLFKGNDFVHTDIRPALSEL
ncbi:MAG: type II toxin-antitoxin system VapC family toxin [Rhizobiales bacterium]|jgi:ribonuclease VapC|nr:type II toxin-antitoxin system VapC family toxin [Hyphomicrobiales bacterium]MDQ3558646.1 type II toxin-antitoxin system VapC family toxin [Pseudomonadota bacterium]